MHYRRIVDVIQEGCRAACGCLDVWGDTQGRAASGVPRRYGGVLPIPGPGYLHHRVAVVEVVLRVRKFRTGVGRRRRTPSPREEHNDSLWASRGIIGKAKLQIVGAGTTGDYPGIACCRGTGIREEIAAATA